MATHKFAAGETVAFVPRPIDALTRRGIYKVVRPMPEAGRGMQYRVKHISDEHERVIDEAQLRPHTPG